MNPLEGLAIMASVPVVASSIEELKLKGTEMGEMDGMGWAGRSHGEGDIAAETRGGEGGTWADSAAGRGGCKVGSSCSEGAFSKNNKTSKRLMWLERANRRVWQPRLRWRRATEGPAGHCKVNIAFLAKVAAWRWLLTIVGFCSQSPWDIIKMFSSIHLTFGLLSCDKCSKSLSFR